MRLYKRILFRMHEWTRRFRYWIDRVIVGDYDGVKAGHPALLFRFGVWCLQTGVKIK